MDLHKAVVYILFDLDFVIRSYLKTLTSAEDTLIHWRNSEATKHL